MSDPHKQNGHSNGSKVSAAAIARSLGLSERTIQAHFSAGCTDRTVEGVRRWRANHVGERHGGKETLAERYARANGYAPRVNITDEHEFFHDLADLDGRLAFALNASEEALVASSTPMAAELRGKLAEFAEDIADNLRRRAARLRQTDFPADPGEP